MKPDKEYKVTKYMLPPQCLTLHDKIWMALQEIAGLLLIVGIGCIIVKLACLIH